MPASLPAVIVAGIAMVIVIWRWWVIIWRRNPYINTESARPEAEIQLGLRRRQGQCQRTQADSRSSGEGDLVKPPMPSSTSPAVKLRLAIVMTSHRGPSRA